MATFLTEESRTFNEYLLIPRLTTRDCTPDKISLRTPLVRHKVGEEADISGFDDSYEVSDYASEPIAWAIGNGILTGRTESTIAPLETATRAETATLIQRMDNLQ